MPRYLKKLAFYGCIIVVIFYSCAPSPYKIIGDAEYANNDFKYILVSERYTNRAGVIANIINASNWESFDQQITYVTDLKVKNFLLAIRLLKEKRTTEAHNLLARMNDTEFDCQVKVLKTDCMSNLKIDSIDFRKKYQEAFDCTMNPMVKIIAKTHYRFHQYGR